MCWLPWLVDDGGGVGVVVNGGVGIGDVAGIVVVVIPSG